MSKAVVLYLHVHQPYRLKQYTIFDTARDHEYFNDASETDLNNRRVFERICEKSYRPMNALLEQLLARHDDFKLSLSITGTFIEQAEQWAPDVIDSFKRLVATDKVEILAETYHHTLSFFYSRAEFERDVRLHREKIEQVFHVTPSVFRNTELAYDNSLATWAERRGYKGIVAEGWDPVLNWRSPNHLYKATGTNDLALLLKNYRLSDDLAFRFGNQSWAEWPLTAHKFAQWANHNSPGSRLINLFMDYETFGEHQWAETGIFNFFDHFVSQWLKTSTNTFYTVSDAINQCPKEDEVSMPHVVTWADSERDLSAWNGNDLQKEALRYVYDLENEVLQTGDARLIDDWRKLLTSDHVYYMSTKQSNDASVHSYFSPYDSPYDAFLSYINAVRDIRWRIMQYRKGL
jgi:alpha-amylase